MSFISTTPCTIATQHLSYSNSPNPSPVIQPEENLTNLKILALCASLAHRPPVLPRFCIALKFKLSQMPKPINLKVGPISKELSETKVDHTKSKTKTESATKKIKVTVVTSKAKAGNSTQVDDEETETDVSESEEAVSDTSSSDDSDSEKKVQTRTKKTIPTKIKNHSLTDKIFNEMLKYNLGNREPYSYSPREFDSKNKSRQDEAIDRKKRNLINRIKKINSCRATNGEAQNVIKVYELARKTLEIT